jgi:hypothetical protein
VTKNEKVVMQHWQHVKSWVRDLDSYGTDQFNVGIFRNEKDAKWTDNYLKRWQHDNDSKGINKVWAEAAEFTVDRIESIRCLHEEICQINELMEYKISDIKREIENLQDSECNEFDLEGLITYVRDQCEYARIIERLVTKQEKLMRGMK